MRPLQDPVEWYSPRQSFNVITCIAHAYLTQQDGLILMQARTAAIPSRDQAKCRLGGCLGLHYLASSGELVRSIR